jgi:hypothetical protein
VVALNFDEHSAISRLMKIVVCIVESVREASLNPLR